MCLTVKDGYRIEITKKDIKVYKFINKHWKYWTPVYQQKDINFKYCKLIKALDNHSNPIKKLKIHHFNFVDEIWEGFHSRTDRSTYQTNTVCIIPKGSEICYGDSSDVVSSQLIVFKNYFQYLIYKLKKYFKNE